MSLQKLLITYLLFMDLNWRKVLNTSGDHGHFRQGHTITYIKHLDSLLLYGGIYNNPRLNAVYLYSIRNNEWTLQPTEGRKPNSRSYHAATYDCTHKINEEHLQALLIFGGQAEKGRSLDDFHVLFLKNWTWKKPFLMQFPPSRHMHTMTEMKNPQRSKIIFGGLSLPTNQLLNDVWIFKNLELAQTSSNIKEPNQCSCDIQYTKGDVPAARKGHQAQIYGKNYFLFGGQTKEKHANLQIYCLSLENFIWRRVQTKGKQLLQRSLFSTVLYGSDIFIYGGLELESDRVAGQLYRFSTANGKIEQLKPKNSPSCRYAQSMTIVSSSQYDLFRAYMVGGMQQAFRPFDIYELLDSSYRSPVNLKDKSKSKISFQQQKQHLEIEIIKQKQQKIKMQRQLKDRHNVSSQKTNISIELLLTMIKNEQFLSQLILKKNNILESLLRRIQEYVFVLNQNYSNYGDEDDNIDRCKEEHINNCIKFKDSYQNIDKHYRRNLGLISGLRNEVISYNNEFQGLMETEVDEDV